MHETAQKIVSLFKNNSSELSTSEILELIDDRYKHLKQSLVGKQDISTKRKIAEIHRRVLHHLNKLTDLGILSIVKHGKKGEKFFSLNIGEGEEIIEISPKYKKRVIVSRPTVLSMPIEGYEQRGLVLKYEPATWVDRLNSAVVFCEKINLEKLHLTLTGNVFPVFNDAVNLENFDTYLNKGDVTRTTAEINKEGRDYGKILNFTINLSGVNRKENLEEFLNFLSNEKLENSKFIFAVDDEEIEEEKETLKKIIDVFKKTRRELYIKNKKIQKAPYFIGRAGPYSFIEKEWSLAEELLGKISCLGCSQSSVVIDVNKFYFENGLDISRFSELMFNISKSMLSANSIQRRKTDELFKTLLSVNDEHQSHFLSLSRNYIRIWNFGLNQPNINQEFVLNMINEAKKKINEFAAAEETIYKSCGMTTRFKLALSPAFESAGNMSRAEYSHLEIKDHDDLLKRDMRKKLSEREAVSQIFDGGNDVTFHLIGEIDNDKFIKQIETILSSYKIPLFSFDFSKLRGDTKITQFLK